MQALSNISNIILPMLIFYIITYGLIKKVNVYEEFLQGAKDGMKTVIKIVPTMIGLMTGVGILRASGFLTFLGNVLGRILSCIGFPGQVMPLILVKMFSSSAATGLLLDLFKSYGPDSKTGLFAALIMSSTETIFYTMSVYFMAAKVKKTGYTLPGALIAGLSGIIASFILVYGISK